MTKKLLKAASNPKIKNHVQPKAKRISSILKNKFGVELSDFDAALNGDVQAAQKIGELARQGSLSAEFAPKLAQLYEQIISGTEAYNKAVSDILVQGGKSAIAIDKATMKATLENTKYGHSRSELAAEFVASKLAESQRHKYQMNYTQIKGYIDAHLVGIDQKTTLLEQSNRPELKQIAADEQYEKKELNEALNKGDTARYDLIPEKDYQSSPGLKAKLLQLKTALGF
ncbi:hypothetical protein [Nodularia sp. NIES-3585]|uniref:hypothetical protein n=1 Tax=Nodularia sp. NIES-3585 TaxID=1973477 RepID=UPI000B5C6FB7|nr:hypothetical protein [Nodularia sp. NIES-3585]GAX39020.1 hypothetical protein NIES3585_50720 [Nodularia sp. NIES-3585]